MFKVGLVGAGRISIKHLEAISSLGNKMSLKAVCDVHSDVLEKPEFDNIGKYNDITKMLSRENLDLVVLCTPSGLHAEQALICKKFNVHILSEKPICVKWNDAVKIKQEFSGSSSKFFTIKQNRFNPTIVALKNALMNNCFGKICFIQANVFWTRPQEYYSMAPWRGTWEYDGGALMNQCSHYIDLMHWLGGPVSRVAAFQDTSLKIETEDTGVLSFSLRAGGVGSLNYTMKTYPSNLEGSLMIIAEKGSVKIGGQALNSIEMCTLQDSDYQKDLLSSSYKISSVYGNGHLANYVEILKCLQGKKSMSVEYEEAIQSVEIMVAAHLAARDQKIVGLPLEL